MTKYLGAVIAKPIVLCLPRSMTVWWIENSLPDGSILYLLYR